MGAESKLPHFLGVRKQNQSYFLARLLNAAPCGRARGLRPVARASCSTETTCKLGLMVECKRMLRVHRPARRLHRRGL